MSDSIRLLHVDDDPRFRDMTAKFLSQEADQFEVIQAGRAAEAREQLRESAGELDCIVCDYDLPDMHGVDLLETVREKYPDLPFILFTGKGSEAVAEEALRIGASDYLQKQSGTEQYDLLANRIRNAVEQSRTDQRVAELERVRALVGNVNRALVRASSSKDIETTVCQQFSESDPYVTACITGIDTETMQSEPRTWAGADQEFFEHLEMSVGQDTPGRQTPGGRAYHDREVAVSQDIRNDPQYQQWRDAALERGFESLAVVPLEYEDTMYGLLAIFASRPYSFDESEQQILAELGDDIAHALNAQETRTDLRQTASRLEALFEQSPDMIHVHDADGNFIQPNPKLCEQTGYAADELTDMRVWDLNQTIDPDEAFAIWESMEVGDSHRLEGVYQCKDGLTFPVEIHVRRLNLEGHDRFVSISREITERKERERERNRRIDLFQKAQDIGNVGAWEYDVQADKSVTTDEGFLSEEVYRIYGLSPDADLTPKSSLEFYHPDDRPQVREAFESAVQHGETYNLEARLITDDEQRWVRIQGDPQTEDGEIVSVRGTIKDITEWKRQEQRRDQIISRVTDAIVEVDADWQFTLVNDQAEKLYDMREDNLLGRSFWDVFSQARDTRFEDKYRRVMETREPTSLVEYTPRLDGWFDIQAYPNDDGGVAFYFEEVTERQRQQRRFEEVFNNTYQFIGFLDPDGTVLEANETALSFGGLDREDVVGKPMWETYWWQSSDEAEETAKKAIEQARGGEMFRDEIRIQGDDRKAIIDFSVRPVTNEQGEVTSLIPEGRDITERKQRERELAESEARYRTLAENFPNGGVFYLDSDFRYQLVSGSGFDPIDTDPEDLVGNRISEVEPFSEEVVEMIEGIHEATLAGQSERIEVPYEDRVYEVRTAPVREDGDEVGGLHITQDITERREREEELRRNERRFEAVFNDPNILAGVLDPDGTLLAANATSMEYVDEKKADIIGNQFWETPWWSDEMRPVIRENIEQAAQGEYVDYEASLTLPNGEPYSVEGTIRPVTDESGDVASLVVSARDITDRKEREEQLAESEARYRALAENFPDGAVGVYGHDLRYDLVEGEMWEYMDADAGDLEGNAIHDVFSESVVNDIEPIFRAALDSGETNDVFTEFEGRTFRVWATPLRDSDGEIFAGLSFAQDITDQVERERELEGRNEQFQFVEEVADIGYWEIDTQTSEPHDVTLSDGVYYVHDRSPDEPWDVKKGMEFYHPEDRQEVKEEVERAVDEGEPHEFEARLISDTGSERWVHSVGEPVKEDGKIVKVRGVFQDITERKRKEQELTRQNERLEKFTSVVSHDLRNPLNMVEGRLELAKTECDSEDLVEAEAALNRCQTLVNDLLTLAREGQSVAKTETVSLENVTEQSWATVETADATLNTNAEQAVAADQSRLQQLLENLIRNAIDHAGPDVTVEVGGLEDGFYVADDGPGIPEDDREQVFESAYSTVQDNTGFGLAIVSEIVDAHGWDITVTESKVGGARFEITGVRILD